MCTLTLLIVNYKSLSDDWGIMEELTQTSIHNVKIFVTVSYHRSINKTKVCYCSTLYPPQRLKS